MVIISCSFFVLLRFCDEKDRECLVLEYFNGGSVETLVTLGLSHKRNALSKTQELLILKQAAAGINYLHQRGIVHRGKEYNNKKKRLFIYF
jgi:serine/threonine protein kinase